MKNKAFECYYYQKAQRISLYCCNRILCVCAYKCLQRYVKTSRFLSWYTVKSSVDWKTPKSDTYRPVNIILIEKSNRSPTDTNTAAETAFRHFVHISHHYIFWFLSSVFFWWKGSDVCRLNYLEEHSPETANRFSVTILASKQFCLAGKHCPHSLLREC